jgi:hypothetical protein
LSCAAIAPADGGRYIARDIQIGRPDMRAEIQAIVDEIKQSVGLLRRHL